MTHIVVEDDLADQRQTKSKILWCYLHYKVCISVQRHRFEISYKTVEPWLTHSPDLILATVLWMKFQLWKQQHFCTKIISIQSRNLWKHRLFYTKSSDSSVLYLSSLYHYLQSRCLSLSKSWTLNTKHSKNTRQAFVSFIAISFCIFILLYRKGYVCVSGDWVTRMSRIRSEIFCIYCFRYLK